jgi:hypothetical protein
MKFSYKAQELQRHLQSEMAAKKKLRHVQLKCLSQFDWIALQ